MNIRAIVTTTLSHLRTKTLRGHPYRFSEADAERITQLCVDEVGEEADPEAAERLIAILEGELLPPRLREVAR